jgi:hypothetical protein
MTATTVGRSERVLAAERRIASVAHLLDDVVRVPGTGFRVGLDPIIGLVPIVGDLTGALVSAWIVLEAARFRMPGVVIAQMVMYAAVDFLIGLVPFLGDVFDFGFRANSRNLALFHRYAVDPGAGTGPSWAVVGGVALAFVGVLWLGVVLIGRLLSTVVG